MAMKKLRNSLMIDISKIKLSIGPMSKNIVDSVIEYCEENDVNIALIPSRRQVEHDGGYVNNWTTKEFCDYVRSKTDKVLLVRDHGGPLQGSEEDDGFESLRVDAKNMDLIHIDVWKKDHPLGDGIIDTIKYIKFCYAINPNLKFEIATEEAIRRFELKEINHLIRVLKDSLSDEIFNKIIYCVIQSGTSLSLDNNTGEYSSDRLVDMIEIVKSSGMISKEHNGDYLEPSLIKEKFDLGLDCINIAPEFGRIETETILEKLNDDQIEKFYQICYDSKKWVKWVPEDFKPEENKLQIIKISGHYVFSYPKFLEIKESIGDIDDLVKERVKKKISEII